MYAVQNKRKLLFCDYLLIFAGVSFALHKGKAALTET